MWQLPERGEGKEMRKLRIRHCKKTRNGAMGNFHILGGRQYLITISDKLTKSMLDYFHTVAHEILHWVFTLVRIKYDLQLNEKKEHKLIEQMEESMTDIFIKNVLRPKEKRKHG